MQVPAHTAAHSGARPSYGIFHGEFALWDTGLSLLTCLTPLALITVDPPGHVVNHRGEVSGSVKTDGLETLVIGLHYPLDTAAVRVLRVAVLQTKPLVKNKNTCGNSSKSTADVAKNKGFQASRLKRARKN